MMREYKVPANFFAKYRIRVLVWTLIISGVALAVGIRIGMASVAWLNDESPLPAWILIITVVITLIALIVGIGVGLRRVQRTWASYRLILDENFVRRVQDGYPEVTIQTGEISKITETEERGIVVHSMRPYTYIGIPREVVEYSEIRADLAKKHAIESISRARGQLMQVLTLITGLLASVAFWIIFLAKNKYVIVVTSSLLFIVLIVSMVVIRRSGSTSKQAKQLSWLTLLSLLAIAIRVLFVVANW